MSESNTEELNSLFATSGEPLESDVVAELLSILRLHDIPAQELFYKWESYSMKMGSDELELNIETARALKKDVQDSLERENRSKIQARGIEKRGTATPRTASSSADMFGMLDNLSTPRARSINRPNGSAKRKYDTPSISRIKSDQTSSPPEFKTPAKPNVQVAFNDRSNAGEVIETLNGHVQCPEPPIAPYAEARIKPVANSDLKKLSYKNMAMKSSDASEILDDRIDEFMTLIQAFHSLDDSAFGSAASQSTNEIVAVGRIALDSSDGRLNTASLVLETSRRMGAGLRIPLKIGSVPGYQLFPGQIVAVKGINASGEDFTVSEILNAPLLPVAASTPSSLNVHIQRLRGDPNAMDSDSPPPPLNIIIGAGPYTADDNLDFEPLHAICGQAADTYADAIILTGPFLDVDHPLIALGDFDLPDEALNEPDTATLMTVFKYLVTPAFQRLVSANPTITILLVPSIKDAISNHVSWPQEPFPRGTKLQKNQLGLPKAARIVGNPMTVALNEIVTGITTQDILYELRNEELTGGRIADPNVLSRLPRYMIEQRHFFPLYPPADRTNLPKTGTEEGVPVGASLDLSYLKLGEILNVRPDMLIVPSALPPFAKVVESVLVINPGTLSKRKGAGTYARVTVYPASLKEEETGEKMVGHKLFERARVDIVRI